MSPDLVAQLEAIGAGLSAPELWTMEAVRAITARPAVDGLLDQFTKNVVTQAVRFGVVPAITGALGTALIVGYHLGKKEATDAKENHIRQVC